MLSLVLVDDKAHGDVLSEELWRFSRPDEVRDPSDVTVRAFAVIRHPTQDLWAVKLPPMFGLNRHDNVLTKPINPIPEIELIVDDAVGALTQAQNVPVLTVAMITAIVQPQRILTESQANTAGWFDSV